MKCVFYFKSINSVGGVETFFYNLAQKYIDLKEPKHLNLIGNLEINNYMASSHTKYIQILKLTIFLREPISIKETLRSIHCLYTELFQRK